MYNNWFPPPKLVACLYTGGAAADEYTNEWMISFPCFYAKRSKVDRRYESDEWRGGRQKKGGTILERRACVRACVCAWVRARVCPYVFLGYLRRSPELQNATHTLKKVASFPATTKKTSSSSYSYIFPIFLVSRAGWFQRERVRSVAVSRSVLE